VTFALRHATGIPVSLRHCVPLLVVVAGLGLAAGSFFSPWARAVLAVLALSYVTADLGVSIWTALGRRDAGLALRLPLVFPAVHAAYGGGSLLGLLRAPWCRDFWVRRARRPGTLPGASS